MIWLNTRKVVSKNVLKIVFWEANISLMGIGGR